jgi:hypothetical protein
LLSRRSFKHRWRRTSQKKRKKIPSKAKSQSKTTLKILHQPMDMHTDTEKARRTKRMSRRRKGAAQGIRSQNGS